MLLDINSDPTRFMVISSSQLWISTMTGILPPGCVSLNQEQGKVECLIFSIKFMHNVI